MGGFPSVNNTVGAFETALDLLRRYGPGMVHPDQSIKSLIMAKTHERRRRVYT